MIPRKLCMLLMLISLLLAGCADGFSPEETLNPTQTATSRPTETATATSTLPPTATATPQPSPTATPTPTPMPGGSLVISPDTVAQVDLLDWVTYGGPIREFYIYNQEMVGTTVLLTNSALVGYNNLSEMQFVILLNDREYIISENQRYLAQRGTETYTIEVFDLLTGERIAALNHLDENPSAKFHSAFFGSSNIINMNLSPDGSLLAAYYADDLVTVWDVQTGQEYSTGKKLTYTNRLAFSSNNQYLAVSYVNSLSIFDLSSLAEIQHAFYKSSAGTLVRQPFSPSNHYLLTSSGIGVFGIYDIEAMNFVGFVKSTWPPEFSTDEQYLILYAYNLTKIAYDIKTKNTVRDEDFIQNITPENPTGENEVEELSVDVDVNVEKHLYLSVGDMFLNDQQVVLFGDTILSENYPFLTGKVEQAIRVENTEYSPLPYIEKNRFAFSGERLYFCAENRLYEKHLATDETNLLAEDCAGTGVMTYNSAQNVVAYPIGNRVSLIDLATGEPRLQVFGFHYPIAQMEFSDDGRKLMMFCDNPNEGQYSSEFDEILLYALDYEEQEGKLLNLNLTLDRFRDYFSSFTLSGDGNYLAVGADGKIFLWDFTDVIMRQRQWRANANAMTFSPDGRLIAVSDWSNDLIYIFETATSNQLAAFPVEIRTPASQLLFSPDGKSLYVRTGDAVSVWGVP